MRFLALFFACLIATSAQAIFVPAGLQPGDHYHIVFVTSDVVGISATDNYPPSYGDPFHGVEGADYAITDIAAGAGYIPDWNFSDITWKAILSTSTVDAKDHINVQGPVYDTQGELVANDSADLWDGSIAHAIQYDEAGGSISSNLLVWTGTSSFGHAAPGTAGNWTDPNATAGIGNLKATNAGWDQSSATFATGHCRLYGISPLLTVPLPGDFNSDGVTDAADYVVWRERNGPTTDYDLWRAHFGESIAGGGAELAARVPEPTCMMMLALSVALIAGRRAR